MKLVDEAWRTELPSFRLHSLHYISLKTRQRVLEVMREKNLVHFISGTKRVHARYSDARQPQQTP